MDTGTVNTRKTEEEYDIIVRFDEKYRSSITEIENIIIPDGKGQKVRLKELGEIQEFFSPPNIERKSKQRLLKVSITPAAGVALGDIATAAQEIIDNTEILKKYPCISVVATRINRNHSAHCSYCCYSL